MVKKVMATKKEVVIIRLDKELKDSLRKEADAEMRSMSSLAAKIIKQYIDRKK